MGSRSYTEMKHLYIFMVIGDPGEHQSLIDTVLAFISRFKASSTLQKPSVPYNNNKGAFNNYVDNKRWASAKSTLGHAMKGQVLCKMSTIVHSMGVGGQNRVKFGPRSCRMPPQQKNDETSRSFSSYSSCSLVLTLCGTSHTTTLNYYYVYN